MTGDDEWWDDPPEPPVVDLIAALTAIPVPDDGPETLDLWIVTREGEYLIDCRPSVPFGFQRST